jgi:para-aminobenzoate synthetase component 1
MPSLPLVHELIPAPDPWDVARKLAHLPHLCFLDSSDRHSMRGRYSYVMADPSAISETVATPVHLNPLPPILSPHVYNPESGFPPQSQKVILPQLPPFQGGIVGAFGYGINREFERIANNAIDEFDFPDLILCRYDWVLAFDHRDNRAWLISHSDSPQQHVDVLTAVRSSSPDRITPLRTQYSVLSTHRHPLWNLPDISSNFSRAEYLAAVRKVIDYIHAGDVFQVNLSQRLLTPLTEHPLDLYGRLRLVSPSPYGCYFDAEEFQILSSSPEQFLQLSPSGEVVTRPIKGTRPRGKTPEEDAALLCDLITNPKDRAENVMIVDLMRNDLGRVCEYGSVTVPKVCEVESHNYVHHLVSEIRGQLAKGKNAFDLLRACFPGGSVTGAPKVRAMEIIAELEPTARGPYCGSMGWIGFDGAMDSNILIRTMTAGKGWLQFPVGGGIVADSDPEREYEETLHKAAGMLNALKKD